MSNVPAAASVPTPATAARLQILLLLSCLILSFATQIILRRKLAPGEFGTFNTLFGLVLIAVTPASALCVYLRRTLFGNDFSLIPALINCAILIWGFFSIIILLLVLPALQLPRISLSCFTILAVVMELLALCGSIRLAPFRMIALILIAMFGQLLASVIFAHARPSTESGLGAVIVFGVIAGLPILRVRAGRIPLSTLWQAVRPRLLPIAATISIAFGLVLFTNADRIAAQHNFGTASSGNMGIVNLYLFDDYQTAGILARYLLWSTLPLLFLFYAQRAALKNTTHASLRFFWIYLGVLLVGDILLVVAAPFLTWLLTGDFGGPGENTALLIPGFAGAVFMLGLLQGISIFALASRRWTECFVIGTLSILYTIGLFYAGHQPQVLTACMFGGALISLMLVLFIGVVRYARSHP